MSVKRSHHQRVITTTVLVAALGYFVDIYDLVLFSIVRVASLKSLGVPQNQWLEKGVFLLNMQMAGMLTGGVLWGILGDKKGRISVLFGSIFLYSLANIANAFVGSVPMYGVLRFVAGVGLAGELGAAITLVTEIMPKESRGYGTTIVAAVGVSGAVVAALIGDYFTWKTAYIVGGTLGLLLLLLRIGIYESGMFQNLSDKTHIRRGEIRMLFQTKERTLKYLSCIFMGVPIWFVIGILVTFSPEIARELGVQGSVSAGRAIMMTYIGLVLGDFGSGFFSQWMRSRKKVVWGFLLLTTFFVAVYGGARGLSLREFYGLCICLGFAIGYWAMFVTMAAEQFGTNLRATVTTTTPNFVRGSVVLLTLAFQTLQARLTLVQSAMIVGTVCLFCAFLALSYLKETFGKDLDYWER